MAKRTPQKPAKSRKTPGKSLRDSAIVASSLMGKTNVAIAAELGIDRETVAKVLGSEDIKRLCGEIDYKLSSGIEKAVSRVLSSVKYDTKAAVALLRNFGSMRQSMKLEHTGKDGAPLGARTDAEIDARIELLLKKAGK